jgi:hypothetical protein
VAASLPYSLASALEINSSLEVKIASLDATARLGTVPKAVSTHEKT